MFFCLILISSDVFWLLRFIENIQACAFMHMWETKWRPVRCELPRDASVGYSVKSGCLQQSESLHEASLNWTPLPVSLDFCGGCCQTPHYIYICVHIFNMCWPLPLSLNLIVSECSHDAEKHVQIHLNNIQLIPKYDYLACMHIWVF